MAIKTTRLRLLSNSSASLSTLDQSRIEIGTKTQNHSLLQSNTRHNHRQATIAERNLESVILISLADGPDCTCSLAGRIQSSNAIFLGLLRQRIVREMQALAELGLLASSPITNRACACRESYRLTDEGRRYLDAWLEEWRLSRVVDDAFGLLPNGASMGKG